MKTNKLFILTLLVVFYSCTNRDEPEINPEGRIVMTFEIPETFPYITISMAGFGPVIIDWGDGTVETHHLIEEWNFADNRLVHRYTHTFAGTIIVRGDGITHFICRGGRNLTSAEINSNTLVRLDLSINRLTSLNISNAPNLIYLNCSYNRLTSLDVSNAPNLMHLSCKSNQLTNLDVRHNTKLISLSCFGNQLTSLDVSKNVALELLNGSGNQLTSLDLSNNVSLWHIWMQENNLTAEALNALFDTLHDNVIEGRNKWIMIGRNPGATWELDGKIINGWLVSSFPPD